MVICRETVTSFLTEAKISSLQEMIARTMGDLPHISVKSTTEPGLSQGELNTKQYAMMH